MVKFKLTNWGIYTIGPTWTLHFVTDDRPNVDSAFRYQNLSCSVLMFANRFQNGLVKREDLFITTKVI
jgi:hypothetical protein